jgi:site-specific DNA-methyltransferase (adenine-specific)
MKFRGGKNLITDKRTKDNIWLISSGTDKRGHSSKLGIHPARFPELLAKDHIISWSNEGDTILDPYMGSATTGKMALMNKRNFIGCEIDSTYFQMATERIKNAQGLLYKDEIIIKEVNSKRRKRRK